MTDQEMKNKGARRRLLKSVVAGGGVLATGKLLPENWARPVVQSVVLPAHAETSPVSFDGFFDTGEMITDAGDVQPGSILDMFVSPAHAAHLTCNLVSRIQIEVIGGNANICFTYDGGSRPGSTSVDESTGELADAEVVGLPDSTLTGMQVSADASRIEGNVRHCDPFVATRTSGSLSCANLASNMFLSSPFADKA